MRFKGFQIVLILMISLFLMQSLGVEYAYGQEEKVDFKSTILKDAIFLDGDVENNKLSREDHYGDLGFYVLTTPTKNFRVETHFNQVMDYYYHQEIKNYTKDSKVKKAVVFSLLSKNTYRGICSFKLSRTEYLFTNGSWNIVSNSIRFLNFKSDTGETIYFNDVFKLFKLEEISKKIHNQILDIYGDRAKSLSLEYIKEKMLKRGNFFLGEDAVEFLVPDSQGKVFIARVDDGKSDINDSKLSRKLDGDKPMVSLTFDDGPFPKNSKVILDVLKKNDARATFFELGYNVARYPDMVLLKYEAGMDVESHSWSHSNFVKLTPLKVKEEIIRTDDALEKITGNKASMFRPPYGSTNKEVDKIVNKAIVLWSIDTEDWKNHDPEKILDEVLNAPHLDNKIVLMHSIHEETVSAVIKMVPALKKRGFQIVTAKELIQHKRRQSLVNKHYY